MDVGVVALHEPRVTRQGDERIDFCKTKRRDGGEMVQVGVRPAELAGNREHSARWMMKMNKKQENDNKHESRALQKTPGLRVVTIASSPCSTTRCMAHGSLRE